MDNIALVFWNCLRQSPKILELWVVISNPAREEGDCLFKKRKFFKSGRLGH
jgi:hypothetical protein